jgi:hypothetical protein
MSTFILSQNRYASGYLTLNLGVWLFAMKAHIDQKCVLSHFGFCMFDSTTWDLLNLLTDSSLEQLRKWIAEGISQKEPLYGRSG